MLTQNKLYYTGIGTRNITEKEKAFIVNLAASLAEKGYVLRSGGAPGADSAFEEGCDLAKGLKEIFLPWNYFNGNGSQLDYVNRKDFKFAEEYYSLGSFKYLKETTKLFMTRNIYQVFGNRISEDIFTPSEFVICLTSDGCESYLSRTYDTGGTGQAIECASKNSIPVYNLANYEDYGVDNLIQWIEIRRDNGLL